MYSKITEALKHGDLETFRKEAKQQIGNKIETDQDGWLKTRRHLRIILVITAYIFATFLIIMFMWLVGAYVQSLVTDPIRTASFMATFWNFLLTVLGTLFVGFVATPKK